MELEKPAIVYLSPELTEQLSYAAWTCAQQNNIFIRQIQRSVFSEMQKEDLGLFVKFEKDFHRKVQSRHVIYIFCKMPHQRNYMP